MLAKRCTDGNAFNAIWMPLCQKEVCCNNGRCRGAGISRMSYPKLARDCLRFVPGEECKPFPNVNYGGVIFC
jgi:hypothetical protein